MSRLPIPGADNDDWGVILNDFLTQAHDGGGTLKTDSVGTGQTQDSSITTAKLADGAVTNNKITDGAVVTAKLADNAVTNGKITDGTIASTKLDTAAQNTLALANSSLQTANNLSELAATAATARTNLGLGTAATMTPATLAANSAFTSAFAPLGSGAAVAGIDVLRAGLAMRNSTPCRVVFAGSSTTVGVGASDAAHSYVSVLVAALQAAYPSDTGSEVAVIASATAAWGTPSSAHGVHGYNLGEAGTTSANYFTSAERTSTAALAPVLVVHMIGSNDFSTSVAPATYSTNVLAVVNGLKSLISTPLVQVLAHTYQRLDVVSPAYPWSDYRDRLQAIADADPDNVVFADLSATYAKVSVPGSDPWNIINGDNIHQGDGGHALTADMLWRNLVGSSRALAATGTSLPLALVLSVAPAITGTPTQGQVLSCSTGTWSPTPSGYAYQWMRDGAAISGATSATYTLIVADNGTSISCTVSVWRAGYTSATATSNAVTASAPSGGGTDPTTISGLVARFDAGTLALSDDTPVSSWTPSAGAETAALTASGAAQPVYRTSRVNGLPSVVFTAASQQNMDTGNWGTARNTPNTVFVVAKYTTQAGNLFTGRNGVYCYAGMNTAGNGRLAIGAGGVDQVTAPSVIGTTSFRIITCLYNGASSALYIDNATTPVATGTTGSAAWPGLRLGTNSSAGGYFLDGEVAETIVYSGALSTTDITGVMTFLGSKYNITVT